MTTYFLFILAALICFRLSRLIAYEEGPFGVFIRIRFYFGRLAGRSKKFGFLWSIGELLTCPYCLGIWIAIVLALVLFPLKQFFLWWLAIAGAQAFLQSFEKNE